MRRLDFATVYPPEAAAREAGLKPDDPLARLLAEYRAAVGLWERWFLEDPHRVRLWEGDLYWVTHDLTACANCDGQACGTLMARSLAQRTGHAVPAGSARACYYSVAPGPFGPPRFAVYPCTDPAARRQRALGIYHHLVDRARRFARPRLEEVAR